MVAASSSYVPRWNTRPAFMLLHKAGSQHTASRGECRLSKCDHKGWLGGLVSRLLRHRRNYRTEPNSEHDTTWNSSERRTHPRSVHCILKTFARQCKDLLRIRIWARFWARRVWKVHVPSDPVELDEAIWPPSPLHIDKREKGADVLLKSAVFVFCKVHRWRPLRESPITSN